MRFQTNTGFVTVFVGERSIKVDIRDPRLYEETLQRRTQTIEGKSACLIIDSRHPSFTNTVMILGLINDGPEPPPDAQQKILCFDKLRVKLPDDKTKTVTRPKHPKVFDFLQWTDIIESPAITIRIKPTEETANWFGQQVIFPFVPPAEPVEVVGGAEVDEGAEGDEEVATGSAPDGADPAGSSVLDKHFDTHELSVRATNCLHNAGIETVGQLVEKTEAELLAKKIVGRKSLDEIKEILAELGLALKPEDPNNPPAETLVPGLPNQAVENLIARVDELEFSKRVENVLMNEGCEFIFQAVEFIHPGVGYKGPIGAHAWPKNFGWKSFCEFRDIMEELGLRPGTRFTDEQRAKLLELTVNHSQP